MRVSVGVQAIIIRNNKILTIKKRDDDGDVSYILPGGKQIGLEWIDINKLASLRFYPKQLVPRLIEIANGKKPISSYVGDIN